MDRPSEQWSENNAQSGGKPDVNLANDANHLGGIPASDFATQQYVQQFNDTKQSLLLEYIDSQDLAKLQQAKDYVDTMIANQDFSIFAKLTDLQVLSETLNQKIQACKLECETEFDAKIANVVSDVNSNFSTLENAINNANSDINSLNNGMNSLFSSVSNGKTKIAAAITDKGIRTLSDATFDTMASNIEQIEGGGGGYDENFVNTVDGTITSEDVALGKIGYAKGQKIYGMNTNVDTTDANATASDIKTGKTAYVNNQKITGIHEDLDTSDATATIYDILEGKTAYVDGVKMTGNHVDLDTSDATATANDINSGKTAYVNGVKITGTHTDFDTSDATAYSSDIRYGTTAYARGQKITGTLIPESGGGGEYIEKIYGTSPTNINTYYLSNTTRTAITYVYDDKLNRPVYAIATNEQTIEVYSVNENILSNKRTYSYSTLGIRDAYGNIATSINGLYASNLRQEYPYLVVSASNSYHGEKCVINILPFDTDQNGLYFENNCANACSTVIEKCYIGTKEIAISPDGENLVITSTGYNIDYASLNTTACIDIYRVYPASAGITYTGRVTTTGFNFIAQFINNRLIYINKGNDSLGIIIVLDRNGNILRSTSISGCIGISYDGEYMLKLHVSNRSLSVDIIKININYDTGDLTQSSTTNINIQREEATNNYSQYFQGFLFSDSNILLLKYSYENANYSFFETYYVDIENKQLTLIDYQNDTTITNNKKVLPINVYTTKITQDNKLASAGKKYMKIGIDTNTLVAIRYSGNTYYRKDF